MLPQSRSASIEDLRELYQARVPRMFYDYCETGSYTTGTFVENCTAFSRYRLRQRVGRNIDNRNLSTLMAGEKAAIPVALAPVGSTACSMPMVRFWRPVQRRSLACPLPSPP